MKERLIGAAVLVALGVWLIPWVLDGQDGQTEVRSAALQLPAPEEPVPIRTQTLRLDLPQPAGATPAAAQTPSSATPRATTQPTGDSAASPARTAAPTVQPATAADESEPEPVQQATAAVQPPPAAQQTAAPAPASTRASAPAPATEPARTAASTTSAKPPAGSWVVQLGSFSEEENARRLAQRVGTFGYKAEISTHRANGRTLYRVRVGPHETRARADSAASALSAHGFVAQVVAAD